MICLAITAQKASSGPALSFGRIAKPLRGGGGSAAVAGTTIPAAVSGGNMSSASPLARLQNEEGG